MIRVNRDVYLAMLLIVLDCIFDEIGEHKCHLHLIDLRHHRALHNQGDFDIPLLCQRTDAAADDLREIADIHLRDIHPDFLVVQLHEAEQIADDLVLPVDFRVNVSQKFPVHLHWDILILQKRIGQNLHGGHRRLQFMGDIGYKF